MSESPRTVSCRTLPSRGCYTGVFPNEGLPDISAVREFADWVNGRKPIVMWYHAFAMGFEFPTDICEEIVEFGGTPFIRWEPWSWRGPLDESFSLEKLNSGVFDADIRDWARVAARQPYSVLQSFGHEMNTPFDKRWYPWAGRPVEYVAAHRRVVRIFREEGAVNVEWVFSPNEWDALQIPSFYPGNEFMDWLGMDGFNFGDSQPWSNWKSFDQIFRPPYEQLIHLHPEKPIMIAEFGCSESGGNKAAWIDDAFRRIPLVYPRIRAIVWFNVDKETAWHLDSSSKALDAFRKAMTSSDGLYLG